MALVALVGLLASANASAAHAVPRLSFSTPSPLPKWVGYEPSVATDVLPDGSVAVYVVAPATIAFEQAASGPASGQSGNAFWASYDGGRTFPVALTWGLTAGDTDVEVGADHGVYVVSDEAPSNGICVSHDFGRTFRSPGAASAADDTCAVVPVDQQGAASDRPWLTRGAVHDLYLTYSNLLQENPLVTRSSDGAQTFVPCALPEGASDVRTAKPVVAPDGTMYVNVADRNGQSLYVDTAPGGGCAAGASFARHLVYADPGADLANFFDGLGLDGAGGLYVVAAGTTRAGQTGSGIWLFTSHDHGTNWAGPRRVDVPGTRAVALPAVVGGLGAGQLAVGWFGTSTSADPNHPKNRWRYYTAVSVDGGATFRQATVTAEPVHYGALCNCVGPPSGNRNLGDFSSLTVNPKTGCLIAVFPGDPYNRPDLPGGPNNGASSAYTARQTSGPCLARSRSQQHP